eukprot:m.113221 g.113221  ORF g.113221 m.113221 type:complete len:154 (+) comp14124_c0_seq2:765-1226(+)
MFPYRLKQLQERLRREVIRQVRKCPNSMIVLVEVHFMAPGVLTALVDLLGFRQPISLPGYGEVDFRKTVFVMISNHGYDELQDRVTHLLQTKDRAALTYSDFSPLLKSITSSALDEWLVFKVTDHLKVIQSFILTLDVIESCGLLHTFHSHDV